MSAWQIALAAVAFMAAACVIAGGILLMPAGQREIIIHLDGPLHVQIDRAPP